MTNRTKIIIALCLTAAAIGATTQGPFSPPAHGASDHSAEVWTHAQRVIEHHRVTVPWDGRYSTGGGHGFCVEGFNGGDRGVRFAHHTLAPGSYVKVCADGQFWVNDGLRFRGLQSF